MDFGRPAIQYDRNRQKQKQLWKSSYTQCPDCSNKSISHNRTTDGCRMNGDAYGQHVYTCSKCPYVTCFLWDEGGDGPSDELAAEFEKEEESKQKARRGNEGELKKLIASTFKSVQKGNDSDIPEFLEWIRLSKSPDTKLYQGFVYKDGIGTEKNLEMAYKFFFEAATDSKESEIQRDACFQVCNMLVFGLGVERNLKNSIRYNWNLFCRGEMCATARLGLLRAGHWKDITGHGKFENDKAVLDWFQQFTNDETSLGWYAMGKLYLEGLCGLPKDMEKAVDCFTKSTEAKHDDFLPFKYSINHARTELAKLHIHGTNVDIVKAVNYLQPFVDTDLTNDTACYEYAKLLLSGKGIEKDVEKSRSMFEKAYTLGENNAAYELGLMWENGIGSEVDFKKAARWYQNSMDSDRHRDASLKGRARLALFKIDGRGVKAEPKEALSELMYIMDNLRDPEIAFQVGTMFQHGIGTKKNYKNAATYYLNSGELGKPEGFYQCGKIVQSNCREEWAKTISFTAAYQKAAEKNHLEANYELGMIYMNGAFDVFPDRTKAIEYFNVGAKQGKLESLVELVHLTAISDPNECKDILVKSAKNKNVKSMFELGCMYLQGSNGIEPSLLDAISWLSQASALGHTEAQAKLAKLFQDKQGGFGKQAGKEEDNYFTNTNNLVQ